MIHYNNTSKILKMLYKDTLVVGVNTYPCLCSYNEGSSANDITKQKGNDYEVDLEVTTIPEAVVEKGDLVFINNTYKGIASHVNSYENHKTLYITYTTPDTRVDIDTEDF